MKILLDTHVIIWVLTDDSALSAKAREAISDTKNTIYYSLASIWEIAIKNARNPSACPYNEKEIADYCGKSGFLSLDISLKHITELRNLKIKPGRESSNSDPFDRILIAQAKAENMKLFSHDTNFANYDEKCISRI